MSPVYACRASSLASGVLVTDELVEKYLSACSNRTPCLEALLAALSLSQTKPCPSSVEYTFIYLLYIQSSRAGYSFHIIGISDGWDRFTVLGFGGCRFENPQVRPHRLQE